MVDSPFISICILSYNRPETLTRLLKTIDISHESDIEVVISDDFSPKRREIREVVSKYTCNASYPVRFSVNRENLGYDKNFNKLVSLASGRWLIFMGDDDEFVPCALDKVYAFLKINSHLGYVMKSHLLVHDDSRIEEFRYFKNTTFFQAGSEAYLKLFRRSVFIAGFIIRRELALPHVTDRFNGSMLMQLYILAEVVLKNPSAYFDEPFTRQYSSHSHNDKDVMYDRVNKKFIERRPTIDISIEFLNSFNDIAEYIDMKYKLNYAKVIKKDMSKYFYPNISIYRDMGVYNFLNYVIILLKNGFGISFYFYIYVFGLLFLGKKNCDKIIFFIKRVLGRTPQL